ncbi:MFS transporter [Cedecea sp.]|uniref:MFS transporter n=1 Tax=Cedecea sp. TaxID=1970739 RepID=UPI0012ADBE1B|nr:MFS transporter [Enterobacteriaceae bacterium RIT693]
MVNTHRGMALLTALLMFPQIVETLYSPALTDIARHFSVTAQDAGWTLSLYFFGFAAGVLFWGRICDLLGRKPALLLGLLCYAAGAVAALLTSHFMLLLAARMLAAFGAATGSVVTQTVLRDRFSGGELARIFSFMGIALAVSPALGLWLGGTIVSAAGYTGVFYALTGLALVLLAWSAGQLEETRSQQHARQALSTVAQRMLKDLKIWRATGLVALFNISLFSYYSQAPFLFQSLEVGPAAFGLTGIVLALGSLTGAQLNHAMMKRGLSGRILLRVASVMGLAGSVGVWLLMHSIMFLAPMFMVMVAFSMAIPVVLSTALSAYADCRGTAGALFGFAYYLLIGAGLMLSGWGQQLGISLVACAGGIMLVGRGYIRG